MAQAESVKTALQNAYPQVAIELVAIRTKGDSITHLPLTGIGSKGLFIREIEEALLRGDIDMAVHSLKDLPTELPDRLMLGAVLERGDARDALVSRNGRILKELDGNETIGTSSLRRKVQLLNCRRSFTIADIRGNIDTRLKKMQVGTYDALVLAGCGLERAGYGHMITERIDPEIMVPAVCQGIIGIEIRKDDGDIAGAVESINRQETFSIATAERAFLRRLQGGCQIPVGCFSKVIDEKITIMGFLSDLEGENVMKLSASGSLRNAVQTATNLANSILQAGGEQILADLRRHSE